MNYTAGTSSISASRIISSWATGTASVHAFPNGVTPRVVGAENKGSCAGKAVDLKVLVTNALRRCGHRDESRHAKNCWSNSFSAWRASNNSTPKEAQPSTSRRSHFRTSGDAVGTNGNPYYARIENAGANQPHEILRGFVDTNWIPGAQNRVPLKPVNNPLLTVVPGFVRYPPELAYPPVPHTDEPAVVLREDGANRTAWLAGDVERTFWITGHGDLLRLLHNTIRWAMHDEQVVSAEGPGFIEMFCWETEPGYTLHLLNYSNANAFHGWEQSVEPLGAQRVRMKLPSGARVKQVELLRAEQAVPFRIDGQELRFTIPTVADYEVAAITLA